MPCRPLAALSLCLAASAAAAQDAEIRVFADRVTHEVTPYMTGACIEDVNHEIYGGIYSQMIFGESFQEPPAVPVESFSAFGGSWSVTDDGVLHAAAGAGPKLIAGGPTGATEAAVEVRFPTGAADSPGEPMGLAGFILKVAEPGVGADRFRGYEVSLDPARQILLLGRHRQNWEPIREVPCEVPVGAWIPLSVSMAGATLEVRVAGKTVTRFDDAEHPLADGAVGLRTWLRDAEFRNLVITREGRAEPVPFRSADAAGTSGMWRSVRRGTAQGRLAQETERPYRGVRSQRVTFTEGDGEFGVENRGLNRRGMSFVAGKPYEGVLWMRADAPADVLVSLETADGGRTLARTRLRADSADWKRYEFTLTPEAADESGRFAVTLDRPGSVLLGYAFLQPGEWGRYKGLPVRRDVAEGLLTEGVTVLRMGGLMANAAGYRWKNMTGPRDRRPPYEGFWYPHSTNGWGIFDFLDFCEAAGILAIPDVNLDETPQDMADFVEYANGPAESEWGRRRAADGHPAPYRLKYLELGNEEAVDDAYWRKFQPVAEAIWAKDPDIVLIVGDFEFKRPITDPGHVEGAPRIKNLDAHKKILDLAKSHDREVWFDVHIWNDKPLDAQPHLAALPTFAEALESLSPGAKFRVCVLEENSGNHAVRRAIAHAETINGLVRLGETVPVVCAANCLQPDGHNDNGWDQGLLFLNQSKVWLQPPGYVTQMTSRSHKPEVATVELDAPDGTLDAVALTDGKALTLRVVNRSDRRLRTKVRVGGLPQPASRARLTRIQGSPEDANTADDPERIVPWSRGLDLHPDGDATTSADLAFEPSSFTVIRIE